MSVRHSLRAVLAALFAFVLCTAFLAVRATVAAPAAPAKGDPAKAAAKYKTLCVTCHKADGSGGYKAAGNPTPNWTLKKTWDATRTDAYLRDCMTNGKIKSGMVAWGKLGTLKPNDVEDMIAYIHTIKAKAK
jgi:mono/diheme cytochrome c family protein